MHDPDYSGPDYVLEHGGAGAKLWLEMFPTAQFEAGVLEANYRRSVKGDFSHPGPIFDSCIQGKEVGHFFNYCAIPIPLPCAKEAAKTIHHQEQSGSFTEKERADLFLNARLLAAKCMNLDIDALIQALTEVLPNERFKELRSRARYVAGWGVRDEEGFKRLKI